MNTPISQPSDSEPAQQTLFELPPEAAGRPVEKREDPPPKPRLQRAERRQMEWLPMTLDDLIPPGHARAVRLGIRRAHGPHRALRADCGGGGAAGTRYDRPEDSHGPLAVRHDRRRGQRRKLDDLCKRHHAYRWLCGGVSVNYHTLADFRTSQVALLDQLLTASVASLLSAGLIQLQRVAQDGMRVRTSAGRSSFRRRPKLEECYAEAQQQVEVLRSESEEADPAAGSRREQAARQRAARERVERLQQALQEMAKLEAQKRIAAEGIEGEGPRVNDRSRGAGDEDGQRRL